VHPDKTKDALDEWIYFLRTEEISEHPQARGLLKAKEELDYLKMDEKEQRQYDRNETDRRNEASMYESTYVLGEIKGHKVGLMEGRMEGEKNKAYEIAKKLFEEGLALETIKNITGLTDEELSPFQSKE
jgi:predicted transposase/invertase (TIGR01784 family)